MAAQRYCTQCGARIEAGAHFCPECGAPVEAATPPPTGEEGTRAGSWGSLPPRAKVLLAVAGGLLGVLVVVIVVLLLTGDDEVAEGPTTTTPGEVFLEPAGALGTDPFTGEVFAAPVVSTTAPAPPLEAADEATGDVRSESGANPGLYGGTRDRARCSQAQLVDFLEDNPEKADAFLEALDTDPALRWSGRVPLRRGDLDDYIEDLTPVTLRYDTRVTNHGFRDGRPTPRQSVLQAGSAVLVDAYGVPRVRCECGNPLVPPEPVRAGFTYVGDRWAGFEPDLVIVVDPAESVIDVFVLVDLVTGERFERPAGSAGDRDVPQTNTTTSTTTTTTAPPPPPALEPAPLTTAEDALATYLAGLGLTYSGDCDSLDLDTDVGTWCSKLVEDRGTERVYLIGEAFTGGGMQALVAQTETGWAVVEVTPSDGSGV